MPDDYAFDLKVDTATNLMDYTCRDCGTQEHGGRVPNPGLYARMKQHLASHHNVADAQTWSVGHNELNAAGDAIVTLKRDVSAAIKAFEAKHAGHKIEMTAPTDPASNWVDYTCREDGAKYRAFTQKENKG